VRQTLSPKPRRRKRNLDIAYTRSIKSPIFTTFSSSPALSVAVASPLLIPSWSFWIAAQLFQSGKACSRARFFSHLSLLVSDKVTHPFAKKKEAKGRSTHAGFCETPAIVGLHCNTAARQWRSLFLMRGDVSRPLYVRCAVARCQDVLSPRSSKEGTKAASDCIHRHPAEIQVKMASCSASIPP